MNYFLSLPGVQGEAGLFPVNRGKWEGFYLEFCPWTVISDNGIPSDMTFQINFRFEQKPAQWGNLHPVFHERARCHAVKPLEEFSQRCRGLTCGDARPILRIAGNHKSERDFSHVMPSGYGLGAYASYDPGLRLGDAPIRRECTWQASWKVQTHNRIGDTVIGWANQVGFYSLSSIDEEGVSTQYHCYAWNETYIKKTTGNSWSQCVSRLNDPWWSTESLKTTSMVIKLQDHIDDIIRPTRFRALPSLKVEWGVLAAEAYNNVEFFQGNGLALSKDLMTLGTAATATAEELRQVPGDIRKAANVYLAFHYGWKLLAADLQELEGSLRHFARRTSRLSRCSASQRGILAGGIWQANTHVYYDMFGNLPGNIGRLATLLDLNLNTKNIWDLIPFSFVVDWVLDIGSLAEGISNFFTVQQTHKILNTEESVKRTYNESYSTIDASCIGTIEWQRYERQESPAPWYRIPEYHLQSSLSTLPTHFMELGALIVQR